MLEIHPLRRPVAGVVRPPGSKSITNRALVVTALAPSGVSRLHSPLAADDTVVMRRALRGLGVLIDDNDDPWLVLGTGHDLHGGKVDAGASGTTARFITAVAALARGEVVVDGTRRMRQRPIGPLVEALVALGIGAGDTAGFPPVTVTGGVLRGGRVEVDATVSSQFASALLMVAPLAPEPVEVVTLGPVVSRPYLDSTVEIMRHFGAKVEVEGDRYRVAPSGYRKGEIEIEADASAAVYPAVAAAVTGGRVEIEGIPADSRQPDLAVLDHLAAMGCRVIRGRTIRVEGPGDGLQPIDADLTAAPDGALALAVAALFADGSSRLRGLSTLRVKESDRLAALHQEIGRLGATARVAGDTLEIDPGPLQGATVETYDDHRMAMAFAIAGLVVPGIVISRPEVVTKTWPGFFDMLAAL